MNMWSLARRELSNFRFVGQRSKTGKRLKSHRFSRVVRKFAERHSLHTLSGVGLMLMVSVLATWSPQPVFSDYDPVILEVLTLSPAAQQLTTEETIRQPLNNPQIVINQKFSSVHPGLDIQAYKGEPVYPVMKGEVVGVRLWRYAYGNHLLIDHGQGLQSLYAHLSTVDVQEGDWVTTDTVIGLAGRTGQATGPHLHLEILDQGRHINPLSLLQIN